MTLLDRLTGVEAGPPAALAPAAGERRRLASILRNLDRVLNARACCSLAQPDLGTPPPSDLAVGDGDAVLRMQAAIATVIERYEPRLDRVRVALDQSEDDERALRFRVVARLISGPGVAFTTVVDPLGRVTMRS